MSSRPFLQIPTGGPLAAVFRYGLFGVGVSVFLLCQHVVWVQSFPCCGTGVPRDYFHTLATLLWITAALGAAVSLQTLYGLHHSLTLGGILHRQALGFFAGRAVLQALPFLLMLLAQFALPAYQGHYVFAGLIALGLWLALGRLWGPYRLQFQPARAKRTLHRRNGRLAILLSLGVLAVLGARHSCACQDRSPISSTRHNMSTYQTMVETYAMDWGGAYPPSIQALEQHAQQTGHAYWQELTRPCPGQTEGIQPAEAADLLRSRDVLGFRFDLERGRSRCMVLYRRLSVSSYAITGTDSNGRLLENRGGVYVMSNN